MITVEELRREDYKKATAYAVEGMKLDAYLHSRLLVKWYSRYFFDYELGKASHVWGAYEGEEFLGAILVEMIGHPTPYSTLGTRLYVGFWEFLHRIAGRKFVKESMGVYDNVYEKMYAPYEEKHTPDGEIVFLTASPSAQGRGVGTALLRKVEESFPGKEIYLFTDSNCTYQFYEHRGFCRYGEQKVDMKLREGEPELTCYLYGKQI